MHQAFYLIADVAVLFCLLHCFQGYTAQKLTEPLWRADLFISPGGATALGPNILWSTPPIQKSTIETASMASPSMPEVVCVWQIYDDSSSVFTLYSSGKCCKAYHKVQTCVQTIPHIKGTRRGVTSLECKNSSTSMGVGSLLCMHFTLVEQAGPGQPGIHHATYMQYT